jgi:hypothetical protein
MIRTNTLLYMKCSLTYLKNQQKKLSGKGLLLTLYNLPTLIIRSLRERIKIMNERFTISLEVVVGSKNK